MKKQAWNDKGFLDPKFLGSWDIPESGKLIVKIKNAEMKEVDNFKTNKKEQKLIIILFGYKPMVCNITNAKAITSALGSKYLDNWENKYIEIGTKKIRAFGSTVDALRVKDTAPPPPQKPELTPESEKWEAGVKFLVDGGTFLNLEKAYSISAENKERIIEESMSNLEEKQEYENKEN